MQTRARRTTFFGDTRAVRFLHPCPVLPVFRHSRSALSASASQNRQNETLTQYAICVSVRRMVKAHAAARTKIPMGYYTNLPCLRQSRRRQTSLALKAPRAFNLSKLGAPNCFRALNRSAQAGRRACEERNPPKLAPHKARTTLNVCGGES